SGRQPPIPSFRKWLGYAKLFLGRNTSDRDAACFAAITRHTHVAFERARKRASVAVGANRIEREPASLHEERAMRVAAFDVEILTGLDSRCVRNERACQSHETASAHKPQRNMHTFP
ncbi:hypothetical protein, partial [Burkholderia ubonensis]|uniref:hypothetical protein n=1 Tax=Burkholderia ubonensis TaxID=101571 RepID=UPI001E579632